MRITSRLLGIPALLPIALLSACKLSGTDPAVNAVAVPSVQRIYPLQDPGTSNIVTFSFSNLIPQIGTRLIVYYDAHCTNELIEGTNPDGSSSTTLSLQLKYALTLTITARAIDLSGTMSDCSNSASYTYASPNALPSSAPAPVPSVSPMPVAVTQMAVAYQINPGHSGYVSFSAGLVAPTGSAWSATFPDSTSYPVIANGKAYIVVRGPTTGLYGNRLYCLDLATGTTLWGPINIAGTYYRAGHTYDNGKVFVLSGDGVLRAFDATTGTQLWSVTLPYQYAFSAAPTAVNGLVYISGAGTGGTVYAVNEINGAIQWTANVANGDMSSPAISDDGVFVSYPCNTYKFAPGNGMPVWHNNTGCSGGGGKTTAYANSYLYQRDISNPIGTILSAVTGNNAGNFGTAAMSPIPAIDSGHAYFLIGGTLQNGALTGGGSTWSFAGDGGLVTAPIVVNNTVIVGSSTGNVYSVNAVTGAQVWSGAAGAPIAAPDEQNVSAPLVGLGAGEGYLLVPAGSKITAWRLIP